MSTEQLMILINEFVDGELPREKETYLFTELGNNEVAREYFKKVSSLKVITNEQTESFPNQLDSKILNELKKNQSMSSFTQVKAKAALYIGYFVLFISIAGGYFLYDQNAYQEEQLKYSQAQIEQQQQLIKLIMSNQLSPITVEPDYQNEIVIKATL